MSADDFFGPALPPGFSTQTSCKSHEPSSDKAPSQKKRKHSRGDSSSSSSSSHSSSPSSESESDTEHSNKKIGYSKQSAVGSIAHEDMFGPALPPGYCSQPATAGISSASGSFIGPVIPEAEILKKRAIAEDDGDIVGPLPSVEDPTEAKASAVVEEIEARARHMKDKLLGLDQHEQTALKREEWMTELPPEMGKNFGVTARTFSTKTSTTTSDKDRSAWTDTPADRQRKEKELLEGKVDEQPLVKPGSSSVDSFQVAADAAYRQEVDEYNKLARPKSLMEMHSDKLHGKSTKSHHSKKKKKKDESDEKSKKKKKKKSKDRDSEEKSKKKQHKDKKPERVPFDREKDLQLTRLDDAQRKSVIKRSHELDGRFGHGQLQFL